MTNDAPEPCLSPQGHEVSNAAFAALADAAMDQRHVSGWTHNFYRYPARFSPQFAAAAIEQFSRPGDLILDPYMGGGTAVVEGAIAGRHIIGNDLNSLAAFVARVKTTALTIEEEGAIRAWTDDEVPRFTYRLPSADLTSVDNAAKTKNLSLARARYIRKVIAAGLVSVRKLPTSNASDFARCALLGVSQWALDGKEKHTSLRAFRHRLAETTVSMLTAMRAYSDRVALTAGHVSIVNADAAALAESATFREQDRRAALVITSPPYPGVHVLYHRWQVDGRRETPAPYWITGCDDGRGAAYYNFGDRRQLAQKTYFQTSLSTLTGIRRVTHTGGYMVQLIAFNRPDEQLPRYMDNMRVAGFEEVAFPQDMRIWRHVPNRKWHARQRGQTHSANEVVLVHRAI